MHTLDARLFPAEWTYVDNHAEEEMGYVDRAITKMLWPLIEPMKTVRHVVVMDDGIGDMPDDAALTMLSIPGTHNSCSIEGPFGFAKTQDSGLPDQLDAGIRFLDIRLAHYQDNLCAHHDVVCMEKTYAEVLTICPDCLGQYPSAPLLQPVTHDGPVDRPRGKYPPAECPVQSAAPASPAPSRRT